MFAALLLLAALPQSQAAAYYFTDIGTRGLARGGAYIAGNRDLSAQYYNPAALIQIGRPQAYVNYSMVAQSVDFTRADQDASGNTVRTAKTVHNIAKPMQIPAFGFGHHFGVPNTMFAIGVYPPFAPDMEYPAKGPQRYTLIDSLVWQIYAGPSVAHRFSFAPWLTVGAGFLWSMVRAEETLAVNVCDSTPTLQGTPQACDGYRGDKTDLIVEMKMIDKAKFTANFGLLIEPTDWVKIGISVMPPIPVKGKGELTANFGDDHWLSPNLVSSRAVDKDITVSLNMPLILRTGVAVNPIENWQIEAATVYERWQVTEEILISDLTLELQPKATDDQAALAEQFGAELGEMSPILLDDDVVLPANYQSSLSYRLGSEYDLGEMFSFRGGGFYEQSAIPPETQGVALVDGNKFGYGLGATFHFRELLSFDLGFGQSFIKERTIRNSELTQLQIPVEIPFSDIIAGNAAEVDSAIGPGDTVGNGKFAAHTSIFSMGLTFYFGKEMRTIGK
jgi:long-subunit fatty acid transport protein